MRDLTSNRTALIAGATGLVGSHLLTLLLNDPLYSKVKIIVRKEQDIIHPKLEQHIIDFNNLSSTGELIKADDVFCCLGTTIKKAGSQEAFKKVDFVYPLEIAKISLLNGAKQFLIITAMGADPHSRIFYNRIKGEIEEEIMKLNFRGISIFRPSLILGERKEHRPKEKIAETIFKIFSPLLIKKLKKYRAIEASAIAKAITIAAKESHTGIDIFESDRIQSVSEMKR